MDFSYASMPTSNGKPFIIYKEPHIAYYVEAIKK